VVKNSKWGTITEAAEFFSVTRQRVHQMLVLGQLGECRKVEMMGAPASGEIWLIPKPFMRGVPQGRIRKKKEKEKVGNKKG
jgi:hypothetical protein